MLFDHILVPNLYGRVGDNLSQFARQLGDVTLVCPTQVETVEVKGRTLLVADRLPRRTDVDVLLPMGASRFLRILRTDPNLVDHRQILVPHGTGQSGVQAAKLAASFSRSLVLRDLDVHLLFYHTTWRNPVVEIGDPASNMEPGAHAVLEQMNEIARTADLRHNNWIELEATTVPDGIIRLALRRSASLVVMARGNEVRLGSYVDQMAEFSPVPLLIARDAKQNPALPGKEVA